MLTRHLVTVLVGIALVVNPAAHAAPRQQDAGSFLRHVVGDLAANRYAAAWRYLYPIASRALKPACC
jgi:hypothetical protein